MNTYDATATLTYREGLAEDNYTNGYYTLNINETLPTITSAGNVSLVEDYDLDGSTDTAWIDSNGNINFEFSSGDSYVLADFNCTGVSHTVTGSYPVAGDDQLRSVDVIGDCGGDTTINATITTIPKRGGEGFFTVEYLQRGTNPVNGNLQTGDVIKIYYESPRHVQEDEEVRINFIPKIGTPTLTQFITPEVISTQRVYLYP